MDVCGYDQPVKRTLAILFGLLVLAGCGSQEDHAKESAAPTSTPINSWSSWAAHYNGALRDCTNETDACYTDNHQTLNEMRQSILDANLEIDSRAGVADFMQQYQDAYDSFVERSCVGGSREPSSANVVCNVKRRQMDTYTKYINNALTDLSVSS